MTDTQITNRVVSKTVESLRRVVDAFKRAMETQRILTERQLALPAPRNEEVTTPGSTASGKPRQVSQRRELCTDA